jgi:hypothetical protein
VIEENLTDDLATWEAPILMQKNYPYYLAGIYTVHSNTNVVIDLILNLEWARGRRCDVLGIWKVKAGYLWFFPSKFQGHHILASAPTPNSKLSQQPFIYI